MNEMEAIRNRHAVRDYKEQPIGEEAVCALKEAIDRYNKEAGLHMQLVLESPEAFQSLIPAFGRFKGVKNYIALVAGKTAEGCEKCGYYGAKLAIAAQMAGLNSCFVTTSFKPAKCKVELAPGETVLGVIAIGYGRTQGKPHKSKGIKTLGRGKSRWFLNGMEAAALAPTGLNRQNFFIEEVDGKARAKALNDKPMTKIDLGIVKYHFETGAGRDASVWERGTDETKK